MADVITLGKTSTLKTGTVRVVRSENITEQTVVIPSTGSVNILTSTDRTRSGEFVKLEGDGSTEVQLSFNGVEWFTVSDNVDVSDILGRFARFSGTLLARKAEEGSAEVNCYVAFVV